MSDPLPALPEWEVPVAKPVVTLVPMESLAKELLDRDILDLQGAGIALLLLTVLILCRRTVRRPFR